MYVTPHPWTPFGREALRGAVVEPDQRKWDFRHQVLALRRLRPWRLFVGVKWLELWFHLRPRRLWRVLRTRDGFRRRQLLWVLLHIGLVWVCEKRAAAGRTSQGAQWLFIRSQGQPLGASKPRFLIAAGSVPATNYYSSW